MTNPFARIGTANAYDSALRNISARQNAVVNLQGQMSSGKNVSRGSDDPTAAAQAERATTRLSQIDTQQRALTAQRNTIASAEATLGNVNSSLQDFRDKIVNAGNGAYTPTDRANLLQQLTSLREQVLSYANQTDSNGQPLFGGLGSTSTPFADGSPVAYNGLGGQAGSNGNLIASTIDGQAAFMNVPTGNGTFAISLPRNADGTVSNAGSAWADLGKVTSPSAVTGHQYTLTFSVDPTTKATTYSVGDLTDPTRAGPPALPALPSNVAYKAGEAIAFDGQSFVVKGTPANGDTMGVAPSKTSSIFQVMDQAISDIGKAGSNVGAIAHTVAQSLGQIDTAAIRVSASRGYAGELLNRADRIGEAQESRSVQVTGDLAIAEGSDQNSQVKRISDFQNQQTNYSAALQSYAQIQKLSLFNYIG
jgi:flagellar hook-associated protein 3 FlgL